MMHIELRTFLHIFKNILNAPYVIIRGLLENDLRKITAAKYVLVLPL